jgi:adenylosuccinate synthase
MIEYADVVVGLVLGDEGKGKITSALASERLSNGEAAYDMVARWAGGNNAGHTVYVGGLKYKTHLVPSGVFYGIPSIIGPGCVVHPESLFQELEYLKQNGFDANLVKVSPRAHIVTQEHIDLDKQQLAGKLGTTGKGIAPAYSSKAARTGILAKDVLPSELIWDEKLHGRILCEGAQGVWLDLDHGDYPFVTSSTTLTYGACSIGFPPQKIRKVWGIAKIYDTKSGEDPRFPQSLFDDPILSKLGELGEEYGVTTGRRRKVNWLDLGYLIRSINLSGTTELIINKCDIIEKLGIYKVIYNKDTIEFSNIFEMKSFIVNEIKKHCELTVNIIFSSTPESSNLHLDSSNE